MVQYTINPNTGRKIQVGGTLYNKLVKDGTISKSKKVPSKKVPSKKVPSKKVPSKKVPSKKVPSKKVPSKKVPSKKVPSKKVPSMAQIQKDCNNASKTDILEALDSLSKNDLCKLVAQIPKAPKPVSDNMKKKLAAFWAEVEANTGSEIMCDEFSRPRCPKSYCSKATGTWACPEYPYMDTEADMYSAYDLKNIYM